MFFAFANQIKPDTGDCEPIVIWPDYARVRPFFEKGRDIMNDFEKSKFWRDIYDRTIVKVDEADAKKISRMLFDMRNNRKLRNIGEGSGRELIAALGVFLAEHDTEGVL